MKKIIVGLAVISSIMMASGASAKMCEGRMGAMHGSSAVQDKNIAKLPQVQAYLAANHAMHKAMDIRYTGNADVDFAAGMVPHHQGAVEMAKVVLEYGKDEKLKWLARRIITWQQAEIGMMNAWLAARNTGAAASVDEMETVKAYKEVMSTMHKDMDIVFTGDADVDFARGMIPHHQGAIDMAWVLKKHGRDPMLRKMADDVIRSQSQEIALMEDWLAAHPFEVPKPITKKKAHKGKSGNTVRHHH